MELAWRSLMQRMIAVIAATMVATWSHDIYIDDLKKDGVDGGLVDLFQVTSISQFLLFFCLILRQGGCNIQSEGKANQRWDVDASTLSLLSLVSRDVFLTKCHWMWRISQIGTLKVWSGLYQECKLAGCLIHGPFVLAHSMGLLWRRIGIPIYFDMLIVHGQNSPCSGEMRTELLMFREMPSMPLDFPGPKHGSNCFHQNPVVFARPGLTMGLKKNENDGPVCRLSHMNRDKWEKEWNIRSPSWYHHFFPRTWKKKHGWIVFWGAQQIFGEVWHLETPLLVVFAWIFPKVLLWRVD